MKLYFLNNGVNVGIMGIEGPRVAAEDVVQLSVKLREFFNLGPRRTITEIKIRPGAVESIVKAMAAFDDAPVPLATALSELVNFCRDAEGVVPSDTPATLSELLWPQGSSRDLPLSVRGDYRRA